ncbi:tRNA (adenosine(37)-N6)-dimethylallyltransferase MiaA [Staphylococcus sp. IVB6181]|uniref:tRNA (adenosine(37)-N6)-dimethylallyltransferase MiaA n=1 Tax=Staphylococcus sp. IVB6181 TaxID=2929481 RepID=UPI0021CECA82|nr:tRNA (adenosine(37)-N6)-dimethylallyltransferase MiaA [Staphylococcus sp. IVB6181]UXV34046.1 tRNA (adenosine(37)-N6)-dimethylallyltransferase MiaA [Staphylococcus sp. IVB6181]
MSSTKPLLVVIVGPTAVGKTELSIELAKAIDGEIISGDSMQVYKGMDIGTAKATADEMQNIPHYLIDILNPDQSFSAYDFKVRAEAQIKKIISKGKIPIIAGGTGLYIQSLIYDYPFDKEEISPEKAEEVRQKMTELETLSNEQLHNYLASFDAASSEDIHPNNRKRVLRAVEYYLKTKKKLSNRKKVQQYTENYDTLLIGVETSRKTMYQRINNRVDVMMNAGLLEEVQQLLEQGYSNCQSMQAIGYKELIPAINQDITIDQAVDKLKQHSRNYAKRQMTWFKNKMNVQWFDREKEPLPVILESISAQIKKRSNQQ